MKIVIATPHSRNDHIQEDLKEEAEIIRIKSPEELELEYLRNLNPNYIFFPHWSWIISREILNNFECIIFHMTDLPYGRGGSPLQNLIVREKKETVISAIKCEEGLDTGPVYFKNPLSLDGTAEEILNRASYVIKDMITKLIQGKYLPKEQVGDVEIFKRRVKSDGNLSNLKSIDKIYDFIRMLDADGYPNAFVEIDNFNIEFTKAKKVEEGLQAIVRFTKK